MYIHKHIYKCIYIYIYVYEYLSDAAAPRAVREAPGVAQPSGVVPRGDEDGVELELAARAAFRV